MVIFFGGPDCFIGLRSGSISGIGYVIFKAAVVTEVKNYQVSFQFDHWGDKGGKVVIKVNDELDGQSNNKVVSENKFSTRALPKKTYKRGWVIANPFKSDVYTIDLRPMQVQMNANSRVLNAKLIQFDPAGLQTFLSWHGLDNYEGPGGSSSGSTPFSEILRSYAYDGNSYPFLRVLRELGNANQSNPFDSEAQEVDVNNAPAQTEFQLTEPKKEAK